MDPETAAILKDVHDFYDSAWEKLIITGTVIIAVVGVVVPLFVQWWQRKNLKLSEDLLEAKMNERFTLLHDELIEKIKAEYQSEILKLSTEVGKFKSEATGNAVFLQAYSLFDKKDYTESLVAYFQACKYFTESSRWRGIQRALNNIKICLNVVSKKEFEEKVRKFNVDYDDILEKIIEADKSGLLVAEIQEIREKILQLSNKPAVQASGH